MKYTRILLFSLFVLSVFTACSDDQGHSTNDLYESIATVENPDQSSTFFFRLDNGTLMWTAATDLPYYYPEDGQRILAYYFELSDRNADVSYDHDVKLIDVYEILTKGILEITPETQDSIGNDPITIQHMWIGSDFLNAEFTYYGQNQTHYINLVHDASKSYNDGKIHLEFRHNANHDIPTSDGWGLVSFDLKSLQTSSESLDLVIHTNEYGETDEKTYEFTYMFGTPNTTSTSFPSTNVTKGNIQ